MPHVVVKLWPGRSDEIKNNPNLYVKPDYEYE